MMTMASTLDRETSGMSVVDRSLYSEEEVEIMTTASALDHLVESSAVHHVPPRGIDRLVMRLSLTMLMWARRRVERSAIAHDDHARQRAVQRGTETREREWTRLAERRF